MKALSEELKFTPYNGFPDIELYMDQVIDFLSRSRTNLRDEYKVSPAMVNNYIKAEILPRARGKKYAREHLAHLAVIMRLKQVLSVKDTGELIRANKAGKSDEEFFDAFRERVGEASDKIISDMAEFEGNPADMAMELAVRSYIYKVACEYAIDMVSEYYWKHPEKLGKMKEKNSAGDKETEKVKR